MKVQNLQETSIEPPLREVVVYLETFVIGVELPLHPIFDVYLYPLVSWTSHPRTPLSQLNIGT